MHVQQRGDKEALWNLCPSFVLSAETAVTCSVGQWQAARLSSRSNVLKEGLALLLQRGVLPNADTAHGGHTDWGSHESGGDQSAGFKVLSVCHFKITFGHYSHFYTS